MRLKKGKGYQKEKQREVKKRWASETRRVERNRMKKQGKEVMTKNRQVKKDVM